MIVLTLDVGMSTGACLSELGWRQAPEIKRVRTYNLDARSLASMSEMAIRGHFQVVAAWAHPKPDCIVVEYPFDTQKSDNHTLIVSVRTFWQTFISTEFSQIKVIKVTPAQWKQTPASKIEVFKRQPNSFWHTYHPTVHEKDAARIAWWFSYWGLKGE